MSVIAITGTPATGKTTVAKIVGKELKWKVLELNALAHERKLYVGYDKVRESHEVDIKAVKEAVANIECLNMIIESHYAHDMKCDMIIVLRANPAELRKRGLEKGWKKEKIEENVLAEIMEVCKHEALEAGHAVFEVDTTGKKPEKVAKEIIKIIKKFKKKER
jgi:adenylate kinase